MLDFLHLRESLDKVLSHSIEGSSPSSLWEIHCSVLLGLQCSLPKGWIISFFCYLIYLVGYLLGFFKISKMNLFCLFSYLWFNRKYHCWSGMIHRIKADCFASGSSLAAPLVWKGTRLSSHICRDPLSLSPWSGICTFLSPWVSDLIWTCMYSHRLT